MFGGVGEIEKARLVNSFIYLQGMLLYSKSGNRQALVYYILYSYNVESIRKLPTTV